MLLNPPWIHPLTLLSVADLNDDLLPEALAVKYLKQNVSKTQQLDVSVISSETLLLIALVVAQWCEMKLWARDRYYVKSAPANTKIEPSFILYFSPALCAFKHLQLSIKWTCF